jgi:uncharacterized protein (TIGR03435 family)
VRPSEEKNDFRVWEKGRLSVLGSDVIKILPWCYQINPARIITNCALRNGRFDIVVKTPNQQNSAAMNWLRQAVETTFELTAKMESREMDVYLLAATKPDAGHLTPSLLAGRPSHSYEPGRIRAENSTLADLASYLERVQKKPVLDETGLTNRYDLELKWEAKRGEETNPHTLIKAVREQLGLELTPARRTVEVLVVDKAK